MSKDIRVSYAKRLRKLREEHGYTQQRVSDLADVEYKHIQRLESRRPCDVKLSTMAKIAKAFEITLSELLDDIESER